VQVIGRDELRLDGGEPVDPRLLGCHLDCERTVEELGLDAKRVLVHPLECSTLGCLPGVHPVGA
jgi:hypothetical protein